MNKGITTFITFVAGAAVGSIVTWQLAKKKYESIIQEEIDSVKQAFSRPVYIENPNYNPNYLKEAVEAVLGVQSPSKVKRDQYVEMVNDLGYGVAVENEKKGEPVTMDKPYIIAPEEFGENDYETISLTYYADRVLADEMDEVIDNVDDIVGSESLEHFGEYEDDSVFVRNDRLEVDYEILLDMRNYSDVVGK